MPTSEKFLTEFGFIKDKEFSGYILDSIVAEHIVIERYQEYEYQIDLMFANDNNQGNYKDLTKILRETTSKQHDIKGIRNFYRCEIDPYYEIYREYNGDVMVFMTGHAYRK